MNKPKNIWAIALLMGWLLSAGISSADESGPARNVILLGWDGAQRNHVREMLAGGDLPGLAYLRDQGKMVDIDITTGATATKPGWTQILTGYAPQKTGVLTNSVFQPIPAGYTIFERLEKHFGPNNIFTCAVIGKKAHVGAAKPYRILLDRYLERLSRRGEPVPKNLEPGSLLPNGSKVSVHDGKMYADFPGEPYYLSQSGMDLFMNGLAINDRVGETALEKIAAHRGERFFFFIHFAQPDHDGHEFGENSKEYSDGLRSDDAWTGRIIQTLKDLNLYEQTRVYVTADHGFDEGQKNHLYAPYVFLAGNDRAINRNGDRVDVAPTILKRFGVDLSRIEPVLDGIPLDEAAPYRPAPEERPEGFPRWK